jgi:hypothetical protein
MDMTCSQQVFLSQWYSMSGCYADMFGSWPTKASEKKKQYFIDRNKPITIFVIEYEGKVIKAEIKNRFQNTRKRCYSYLQSVPNQTVYSKETCIQTGKFKIWFTEIIPPYPPLLCEVWNSPDQASHYHILFFVM